MNKNRRHRRKHFVCRFCDQDTERPILGTPIVGRKKPICPVCRGPAD